MKTQAGEEQTRANVHEALSYQAKLHGIVFHSDHLAYPDTDGAPIEIYYRDISRIITTSLYIGLLQNKGFLHIFMCDSNRKVFIDLHVGDSRELPQENITPEQISENRRRKRKKTTEPQARGGEGAGRHGGRGPRCRRGIFIFKGYFLLITCKGVFSRSHLMIASMLYSEVMTTVRSLRGVKRLLS